MRFTSDVEESFDAHTFPTTTDDLVEAYGKLEIELPNGDVTLGEVLGQVPHVECEDADDARLLTYSALGEEAIGRKGYSDRDSFSFAEEGHEQLSL